MTTLNISLPDDLRAAIERQVASGRYANHSAYVRALIRQDQERLTRERLELMLLARLEDGSPSVEMDDADLTKLRAEYMRRAKRAARAPKESSRRTAAALARRGQGRAE